MIDNVCSVEQYQQIIRLYKNREKFLLAALENQGISKAILVTSASQEHLLGLDIEGSSIAVGGERVPQAGGRDDDKLEKSQQSTNWTDCFSISTVVLMNRGQWLIGLLIFQSCSSFILASNESLLTNHPSIIYFLTMLVGAGGNSGNQSAVRVIRGIALGNLSNKNYKKFLIKEVGMAFALSFLLGFAGFFRAAYFSSQTSSAEAFAITVSLMLIVFVSIIFGALLPIILNLLEIDPANSSTSIQVIMDILGVLLTCLVSTTLLDSEFGIAITNYFAAIL